MYYLAKSVREPKPSKLLFVCFPPLLAARSPGVVEKLPPSAILKKRKKKISEDFINVYVIK